MERVEVAGIALDIEVHGEGPPVLLLHQEHHRHLNRRFIEHLASDFRVLGPTHPGFDGRQPPADFRAVADIALTYLELIEQFGLDRPVVLGSSLGGWVALEMAVREPTALGALVLLSPLGVKLSGPAERDFADLYALPDDEAAARLFACSPPDFSTFSDEEMTTVARDRQFTAYYGWKPYMHTPGLRRWLTRVRMPTHFVWGSEDQFVGAEYGRRLSQLVPNGQFSLIEGAAHYPQIENPGAVAQLVKASTSPAPANPA